MQTFPTSSTASTTHPANAPLRRVMGWGSAAGWLGMLMLGGCAQVWGGSTKGASDNCVRNPDACTASQICNTVTEACEETGPQDMAPPDLYMGPQPPTSFIFPGGLSSSQTHPRDALYSIEAQGPATIYYTLDGSYPSPGVNGTLSASSPLSLGYVPGGTTVHWAADYVPNFALENTHVFTASTTSTPPDDFGYISEPAKFDLNGSSVVLVAPGTHLTGTIKYQAWQSTPVGYCPGCVIQYVAAVESIGAVGCYNPIFGGSYPGMSSVLNFAFDAPMNPGRYRLYAGFTLQFSCDGSTGNGPDVGEVVVQ